MKYLINNDGTVNVYADYLEIDLTATQTLLISDEIYSFLKIKYNFEKNEFYEGATIEEIEKNKKKQVPDSVTAIQFLAQLTIFGITQEVIVSEIEKLSNPNKTIIKIAFDRATVFERNNQFVELIRTKLNLTSEDVDDIFINAKKIEI